MERTSSAAWTSAYQRRFERQPLRKQSPYIWTDFNCYGFMQAFEEKLRGPLKGNPYEGPIDLWASTHMVLTPKAARAAMNEVD